MLLKVLQDRGDVPGAQQYLACHLFLHRHAAMKLGFQRAELAGRKTPVHSMPIGALWHVFRGSGQLVKLTQRPDLVSYSTNLAAKPRASVRSVQSSQAKQLHGFGFKFGLQVGL